MNPIPQFKAGSLVRADGVGYVITDITRQRNKIVYWLAPLREGEGGRHCRFEEELAPYAEQAWDQEEI